MPEPIIQRLSQFTPNASGLDRDALLFAAGRASVRPNRGWMMVATALAACQLLTLTLLWPQPTSSLPPVASKSPVERTSESPPSPPDPAELGSLNRQIFVSKDGELPPPSSTDNLIANSPPLHAFASSTPPGLD